MICSLMNQKNRKVFLGIVLALGVVTMIFGIVGGLITPEEQHTTMRLMGMLSGFGVGIMAVAVFMTIRARVVKPEQLAQEEIDAQDERNIAIGRAALSVAAFVGMFVFIVLAFVLQALGYTLPSLLCVVGLYVEAISMFVARAFLNRKM